MTRTHEGRFYAMGPHGAIEVPEQTPDAWICRRVEDFGPGQIPAGAAIAPCSECGKAIVYNPARKVTAPKVCMQCADIEPLPL